MKIIILIISFSMLHPLFSENDKAISTRKWSAMGSITTGYSKLQDINNHIDTSVYNLTHNYNYIEQEKNHTNILLGGEITFFYHIKIPYLIGLGFSFDLNYPGSFIVKKINSEEYFSSNISLGTYLIKFKVGSEFLRLKNCFLRGFLVFQAGLGRLNIKENVSGSDFGESRENNYELSSHPFGVEFSLDFIYRYNIRNGFVVGASVSTLSFNKWTGSNSLGEEGILLSVPLSNDYSKETFEFYPSPENNTNEKTTSFLITEFKLTLGYWQSI